MFLNLVVYKRCLAQRGFHYRANVSARTQCAHIQAALLRSLELPYWLLLYYAAGTWRFASDMKATPPRCCLAFISLVNRQCDKALAPYQNLL